MNYTLITGASRGIGKALAKEFASHNCNLLLVARSAQELTSLAKELTEAHKVHVKTFPLDLLEKDAAKTLYHYCKENKIFVRILVNNAGYAMWKPFAESGIEDQLAMMRLNQAVLLELCYLFIPMMKGLPDAHIMNVASTAAFQPFPGFSTFAATKAFVYSFSRSLRHELKGSGINVTCLCPGPTDTDFFSAAHFTHRLGESEGIKMPVQEVAKKGVADLLAKKGVSIPGLSNKLGVLLSKHLPAGLTATFLGKMVRYEED